MGAISGNGVSIEEALPLDGSRDMTGRLFIDQNTNVTSLEIDSEANSAQVFRISNAATTSGNIILVDNANSLDTGRIALFSSNSANTGTRELVNITNDNTAATGATCLSIKQDAANNLMALDLGTLDTGFIDFKATADADATSAISTLTTSGATTHHIQIEINGVTAWIAVSTTDPS